MSTSTTTRFSNRDWWEVILIALLALAVMGVGWLLGLPQKWVGGSAISVGVFGVAIAAFRKQWSEGWFWLSIAVVFFSHCVFLWIVLEVLLASRKALNIPAFGYAGTSECIVLVGFLQVLRARVRKSRNREPRDRKM
jgi:hypothetical protein